MTVAARTCAGCGKPRGCDAHQFGRYWHLACLLKERERIVRERDFGDRYRFTSLTGRIWTLAMVRKAALRRVRTSALPVDGKALREHPEAAAYVEQVLTDDAFLRRNAGVIPARIVEYIEDRVWRLARGTL